LQQIWWEPKDPLDLAGTMLNTTSSSSAHSTLLFNINAAHETIDNDPSSIEDKGHTRREI
jgi:hypothetical protein